MHTCIKRQGLMERIFSSFLYKYTTLFALCCTFTPFSSGMNERSSRMWPTDDSQGDGDGGREVDGSHAEREELPQGWLPVHQQLNQA